MSDTNQMTDKQFDLFQSAVQWVKDEARTQAKAKRWRKAYKKMQKGVRHYQGNWGSGLIKRDGRSVKNGGYQWREVCPSSACLAGNIVLMNGDTFVSALRNPAYEELLKRQEAAEVAVEITVDYCIPRDSTQVYMIEHRAAELVGIDHQQAAALFAGGNTAEHVIHNAERVAEAHGRELQLI